jgi:hypothetical protein
MAIKTYGLSFMSRWQSALNSVLNKQTGSGEKSLSAEHPAMRASCEACDKLESAIAAGRDGVEIAEVITTGELVSKCAHLYVGLAAAKFTGNTKRVHELEAEIRYSVCDPLWAKTLLEFDNNHEPIPYRHYESLDDYVLPLDEHNRSKLKIAFVSDWGTGTRLAKNVMRRIGEQQPDIVIHLGDVYYSGTQSEMQDHFLSIVREVLPPKTRIFNLAGNHDLYAGGAGYYWLLDELGQPASYFCLRNDHWQILSIGAPPQVGKPTDAISSIPSIEPKEVQWHKHKLDTANGRKTVMLSHYQLFTASGNIGRTADNRPLALNPVLYDAFSDHLSAIDLWLWGHEHNLVAFEPYAGLRRGRCIGSGAIPVALLWQPYRQLHNLFVPEPFDAAPVMNLDCQLGHDGDHYHHAFAMLSIDGAAGEMNYFQVDGVEGDAAVIYTESLNDHIV